jgi:hypothetical protein
MVKRAAAQFHPEATLAEFENWIGADLTSSGNMAKYAKLGQDPRKTLEVCPDEAQLLAHSRATLQEARQKVAAQQRTSTELFERWYASLPTIGN